MPLRKQDSENMIAKCGWLSLDPWLMSILQQQLSVKASCQRQTKLNWSGVTWFVCCRASLSLCFWSIPPLTSWSDNYWLLSLCFSLCTAQHRADKTKRLSLQPLSISYCYPPHSPAPSQRLSACCEGNLNHPLLSVTPILEVSNYCLRVIVLVGRREVGHCSCSCLCIGFKLVVGFF